MTLNNQGQSNFRGIGNSLLALVALGSGLVNLFSVLSRALPERAAILHEIFPWFLSICHVS